MKINKKRDCNEWTKIDVTKEIRDRLHACKYRNRKKYKNVNDIIKEWLEKAERQDGK